MKSSVARNVWDATRGCRGRRSWQPRNQASSVEVGLACLGDVQPPATRPGTPPAAASATSAQAPPHSPHRLAGTSLEFPRWPFAKFGKEASKCFPRSTPLAHLIIETFHLGDAGHVSQSSLLSLSLSRLKLDPQAQTRTPPALPPPPRLRDAAHYLGLCLCLGSAVGIASGAGRVVSQELACTAGHGEDVRSASC